MDAKPLRDRVIIRRIEEAEESYGGIVTPDVAKEKPVEGEVVAVGDGRLLESGQFAPLVLAVGDHVLFGKYAGTDVKIDGEELVVIREDEVMVLLKKGAS